MRILICIDVPDEYTEATNAHARCLLQNAIDHLTGTHLTEHVFNQHGKMSMKLLDDNERVDIVRTFASIKMGET